MGSVYLSDDYKLSLKKAGIEILEISDDFFASVSTIKLPFFGKKEILEARGNPSNKSLELFNELSKKYFYGTIAPIVIFPLKNLEKTMFKVKNYTILISLTKSEEDLWKSLEKKSARWGVKTAERNLLSISDNATKKEIASFYKIYEKTAKSGGFKPEKLDFIYSLCESQIARLILVKKDSTILAGALVLLDKDNNYSILDLSACSDKGLKLQAMPYLYWKIILFSKNLGFKYLDLGGFDKEATSKEKTYSVNKFKERFGGEIKEQPIYSTSYVYVFFRYLLAKARFLKRFYHKSA